MTFFILAGGYGRRAEPLSRIKPKPVFPLNGVPLLTLLLRQLQGRNWRQGFINLHHLGDQVAAAVAGVPGVRFIRERELGGSRVLQQALPFFSDWLLAVNGDTFLEIPVDALLEKAAAADVDGVLLVRRDREGGYAGLRVDDAGFLEHSDRQPDPGLMYAGTALFRKRAVEKIDETNFFNSIKKNRLRFHTLLYEGIWLDVGTPGRYFHANWEYKSYCSDARPNALSENVEISSRSRVERSVLWENTRIGDAVRLSECVVTGDLHLEKSSHSRQVISRQGVFPLF